MRTVFRADGAGRYGLGHFSRCRWLAGALAGDTQPVMICRNHHGTEDALKILGIRDWQIVMLAADADDETDARRTAEVQHAANADLIVSDLCHIGMLDRPGRVQAYHGLLRRLGGRPSAAIGDCRLGDTEADLTVIPYDCPEPPAAQSRVHQGLRYFIGPPVDVALRGRAVPEAAGRLLVVIGGGDPLGVVGQVLEALALDPIPDLSVRAILGTDMPAEKRARAAALAADAPWLTLAPFEPDFRHHLAWADMAITGEGLVKFDTAGAGLPTVVISQFDHDSLPLRRFFDSGAAIYLGAADQLSAAALRGAIAGLARDAGRRRDLAALGCALVDGKGTQRVARLLTELAGND